MSPEQMQTLLVPILYLLSIALFIFGLKGLTRVKSARRGNQMSAAAMALAVGTTLLKMGTVDYRWILGGVIVGGLIGAVAAIRVAMTGMPEMVALFNGCGGVASSLVAISTLYLMVIQEAKVGGLETGDGVTTALSILIGGVTFSGSLVAWGKLNGNIPGQPILLPLRHLVNAVLFLAMIGLSGYFALVVQSPEQLALFAWAILGVSLILGILLVIPIGGADMPVVISLLNSYSGLAAAAAGFVIGNYVLIVAGALVGASGLILTNIMCVAMNRSLANVLFGGFGAEVAGPTGSSEYTGVTSCGPEEAAMILDDAESVIIVPGYGLAVAQAQHVARELGDILESKGATVKYAIHPVAGRMPGHMNVLLAEADVPYEQLVEMDMINPEFGNTDAVVIVGANDVVNPAAEVEGSPIYGMPILEVHHARTTFVIKRSLSPGFAGIKNTLFENDNNMMIFGDGKDVLQRMVKELKES